MKLVMTVMVRDEADIIAPMIEHHLAQGVDMIIVTDNGSTDGTAEILQGFGDRGVIDLRHDPVHRKQQGVVVTGMARDAATLYGADWVINADADEFWMPVDRSSTLRAVFEQLDPAMEAFTVDVIDMIGAPAERGSGLQRLAYRDLRSQEALNRVGLLAHATPDAVHVGDPDVVVHQGNHFVSLPSKGAPPEHLRIEVLHFPWRSWEQYSRKVESAGRAYLNDSHLTPSPNHHGMRDYARLQAGLLLPSYISRHPTASELEAGIRDGEFIEDTAVADRYPSPVPDQLFDNGAVEDARRVAVALNTPEYRRILAEREITRLKTDVERLANELERARSEYQQVERRTDRLVAELALIRNRRAVRYADALRRTLHGRP